MSLSFFPPLFFFSYFTTPKKDEGKKVDEALKKRMASRRDRRKSAMQSKFEKKKVSGNKSRNKMGEGPPKGDGRSFNRPDNKRNRKKKDGVFFVLHYIF